MNVSCYLYIINDQYNSQIRAVDRDIGENRMILYSIVRGNRRSTFKIDAKTGDLSLNRVLKTKEKDFLLSILARDQGLCL